MASGSSDTPSTGEAANYQRRFQSVETFKFVRWSTSNAEYKDHTDCEVWLTGKAHQNLRTKDGSTRLDNIDQQLGQKPQKLDVGNISGTYCVGLRLEDDIVTVETHGCLRLVYYRAVHDGQPGWGLESRAYGTGKPHHLFFQRDLQSHLNTRSRVLKTDFISVTSSYHKAVSQCADYYAKGFTGIKLLTIRVSGPEWDYQVQRMWFAPVLVKAFQLDMKDYYATEFLIENSIPRTAVQREQPWESIRGKYYEVEKKAISVRNSRKRKYEEGRQKRLEAQELKRQKREEEGPRERVWAKGYNTAVHPGGI